ncbi:hypothetical protein ANTQUA_LOCUS8819 [Anthophora quadrimaculata]
MWTIINGRVTGLVHMYVCHSMKLKYIGINLEQGSRCTFMWQIFCLLQKKQHDPYCYLLQSVLEWLIKLALTTGAYDTY